MMKKKTAALAMAAVMALSLTGCGKDVLDGTLTAAVLDGTVEVPLGEVSLMVRYDQAEMQSIYGTLFGYDNMYGEDMYGIGEVYGETAKESIVEELELLYVLEAEAENYGVEVTEDELTAMAEAAAEFIEANTDEAIKAIGVDQEMVEHVFELYTIQSKMYDVLTEDVDTEVTDDEAAQTTVSYLYVSTEGTETDDDGETIDLTDDEIEELQALVEETLELAEEYGDLDTAAEEINESLDEDDELSVYSLTYGADDSSFPDEVLEVLEELEDGETACVYVEDDYLIYGVFMVAVFDEEATEEEKESILEERIEDLYDENCDALLEEHEWETDDDVLALITFDRAYVLAED